MSSVPKAMLFSPGGRGPISHEGIFRCQGKEAERPTFPRLGQDLLRDDGQWIPQAQWQLRVLAYWEGAQGHSCGPASLWMEGQRWSFSWPVPSPCEVYWSLGFPSSTNPTMNTLGSMSAGIPGGLPWYLKIFQWPLKSPTDAQTSFGVTQGKGWCGKRSGAPGYNCFLYGDVQEGLDKRILLLSKL